MGGRRVTLIIWLVTTGIVAGAGWYAYRSLTEIPDLAGRTDPARIYEEPALLFEDPGILGTAAEMQVTRAVRDCMESLDLTFRGPAVVEEDPIDPTRDGYGIAAGDAVPAPRLGAGGPNSSDRNDYERGLYGATLAGEGASGGCAAVGRSALEGALATIDALPYSLTQLEADALAHPAYLEALDEWRACMVDRGYAADSPLDLIARQEELLSAASAEEARSLADEERHLAAADFFCRRNTIDPATALVAADLAPRFVELNRPQLESLIPPPEREDGATSLPSDLAGLGTGDVQVTLRWSASVDLDLEVTDPTGAVINFMARESASGGQLDRDANYPCSGATRSPVENVFWPPGGAPPGPYTVTVIYQSGCDDFGPQSLELTVRIEGEVVLREVRTLEPGASFTVEFGR